MNIEDLGILTQEIERYKSSAKHAELIQSMDQHERQTSDPVVRAVLLIAKATSALNIGDIGMADEALSRIDVASLDGAFRNYVNLTKATGAHEGNHLLEADKLLSEILASKEIHDDEQRDDFYEALARKGFVQADLNQFDIALELLNAAYTIVHSGELSENIDIYKGYCLQALGRLDEAEESLRQALSSDSRHLKPDAYYRLGAVELQKTDFVAARADFQRALTSLPDGRIRWEDNLVALDDADSQLARLRESNHPSHGTKPRYQ